MPQILGHNNNYKSVRLAVGGIDTLPPTPSVAKADRFDADSATEVFLYWGATGEAGTVTMSLWGFDNLAPTGARWVKYDEALTVAPGELVTLKAHGGSHLFAAFGTAPTGTAAYIRASRSSSPH
jgi:hypothetical protein